MSGGPLRGIGRAGASPPPRRCHSLDGLGSIPLLRDPAQALLILLMLVLPLWVWPPAHEAFRLPKLLLGELIALLSLLPLAARLWSRPQIPWQEVARLPVVRALVPLLLVASSGFFVTRYPYHFREALADLWIGCACLAGWSLGMTRERLEGVLRLLIWPATLLALLVIDQHHHLLGVLDPLGIQGSGRYALTGTAGNPGDLASYLVLPSLISQWRLREVRGGRRWGLLIALGLCTYALVLTQTLVAILALTLASALLWLLPMTGRQRLGFSMALLLLGALTLASAPGLTGRIAEKAAQIGQGEINAALTGRLDGWIAAAHQLSKHPWTGVGQGAFRPEFIPAKIALLEQGVTFYSEQPYAVFANAHNEWLEVAAEWGLGGLLALGWALWQLLGEVRRLAPEGDGRRDLAWAGLSALALLSSFWFPWRVALVAFPYLVFLSWILAHPEDKP